MSTKKSHTQYTEEFKKTVVICITRLNMRCIYEDYEIMSALMATKPQQDDAVYRFMCKKRSQGKYYLSAYMAGLNKFLHIYYAGVKPILSPCCFGQRSLLPRFALLFFYFYFFFFTIDFP